MLYNVIIIFIIVISVVYRYSILHPYRDVNHCFDKLYNVI